VATSEDKRRLVRARKERHIARLARGEISLSIDIQPDALWDALVADELVNPDEEPTRAILEEQARRAVIDWIAERLPRDHSRTRSCSASRESLMVALSRGRRSEAAPPVLTGNREHEERMAKPLTVPTPEQQRTEGANGPAAESGQAKKPPVFAHAHEIKVLEYSRNAWGVVARPEHTLEDVLNARYLGLRAENIKAGDHVEVRAHDMSWLVELLVLHSDEIAKQVRGVITKKLDLADAVKEARRVDYSQCRIEQITGGWRIMEGHRTIKDGLPSEDAARKWLRERELGLV
jgi:hypothetical protein